MRIDEIIEDKDKKTPKTRNFVAKYAGINRASAHKDRKKAKKRGEREKHKGQSYQED